MRLLILPIQEPLPGRVLPEMAAVCGPEEAARRYRAIALVTLRQLRGLADCRIRLLVTPADAAEAVRFWLLPLLADKWSADSGIYLAPGWEIDFADSADTPGTFATRATGEILCPWLGARWVHTALLGHGTTIGEITGPATATGHRYLQVPPASSVQNLPLHTLPPLEIIHTESQWRQALETPLGPALKRAREQS